MNAKRLVTLLLALVIGFSAMGGTAFAAVDWQNPPFEQTFYITPDQYPNTDLSQPYEIAMYTMTATPSPDEELVVGELNNILAERGFNTTIKLTHLTTTQGVNTYSLALASGEKIDVILTAPWRYMWQEAAKGSFMVLNEEADWIERYMPFTAQTQAPESWGEVTTFGDIVAVPGNRINPNAKFGNFRQDLMDKHGITQMETWDDFMSFAKVIAEKETPESGIYAYNAATDNRELWRAYIQMDDRYPIFGEQFHYKYDGSGRIPEFSEIKSYYETDIFRQFCHDMKELSDAGAWSKTALTNTVLVPDSFANLTSASLFWNGSVFTYGRRAEAADANVKTVAYDIFSENIINPEAYSNNCLAIPVTSGNPERSAMIIDLLKNDFQLCTTLSFGLEDTHITINEDNTYTKIEPIDRYTSFDIYWALKVPYDFNEKSDDPRPEEMRLSQMPRLRANPTVSFIFSDEPVKAEMAAINALAFEVLPTLELGFVEDVDAAVDDFIAKLYDNGLQKVYDELEIQYTAWKTSLGVDAVAAAEGEAALEAPETPTGAAVAPANETPAAAAAADDATTETASPDMGWLIWVIIPVVVIALIAFLLIRRNKKQSS